MGGALVNYDKPAVYGSERPCRLLRIRGKGRVPLVRRAAALVVVPVLIVAALTGFASSSNASTGSSLTVSPSSANQLVKVSGAFGAPPKVTFPKGKVAGSDLYIKRVITGTGPKLTSADVLVGNFVLYDWSGKTHRVLGSTFSSGSPVLFSGKLLPGLSIALLGQRAGSRVLAVLPPKYGFGPGGNPQIGVKGTDTLVFVVDMLSAINKKAGAVGRHVSDGGGRLPTVTERAGHAAVIKIPAHIAPPKTLVVKTLVQGCGAKLATGDFVVVQFTGAIWRTGKVFDSTWSRGEPFGFVIGEGQVIKGWDDGLHGQKVGSRVMLVIPPADGYGSAGNPGAGIKGTDTLVFVVDILGAYAPAK
jgi:peptidylprolyl isomerase